MTLTETATAMAEILETDEIAPDGNFLVAADGAA
jgi:hypothetical protein